MYHEVGASLYFPINFMCISGFSFVLFLYCFQICLRLWRYVYTMRDEIAAKDNPYEMANVVLNESVIVLRCFNPSYLMNNGE